MSVICLNHVIKNLLSGDGIMKCQHLDTLNGSNVDSQ